MHNFYPYVLLLTGTVLSQEKAIPIPSPPLGCEAYQCQTNTACRYVAACTTCPTEAQCIPISKIDSRIDNRCQQLNYNEALLLHKKTSYRQLRCTKMSAQCPQGGVCVGTYKSKRVCCRDQTSANSQPPIDQPSIDQQSIDQPPIDQPSIDQPPVDQPPIDQPPIDQPFIDQPPIDQPPIDQPSIDQPPIDQPPIDQTSLSGKKPGDCPQNILICGGVMCKKDRECPGIQKCCPSCGSKICSYPIYRCGDSECQPGEICVPKPYPCAPDMMCIQIVIEACVPAGCGKCEYNEDCQETATGYECIPPRMSEVKDAP